MNDLSEITKELFKAIISSEDKNRYVVNEELYTRIVYHKHGVLLVHNTSLGIETFYIQDINA